MTTAQFSPIVPIAAMVIVAIVVLEILYGWLSSLFGGKRNDN